MSPITFVTIAASLYPLRLKGAIELSLLGLVVSFGDRGLTMSNSDLAKTFHVSRRTIIKTIGKLRRAGLIVEAGNGMHRLNAGSELRALADSELKALGVVNSDVQGSEPAFTHKEEGKKSSAETAEFAIFEAHWKSKPNLPQIRQMTNTRRKKLAARMREPLFAENWQAIIDKLAASSFATGNNDRGWKADLDWLLKNSDNYSKVLEGKYDNRLDGRELTREMTEEEAERILQGV